MDKVRLAVSHGLLLSCYCWCPVKVSENSCNLNTKVTPPKQTESSNDDMPFQKTDKLQVGGREKG